MKTTNFNPDLAFNIATGLASPGSTLGGSGLEIKETDGTPDVLNVNILQVPKYSLTDNGGGNVTVAAVQPDHGGVHDYASLGNLGATEVIDLANGNYQAGTLDANCAISFTGWTTSAYCEVGLRLTEDATGGRIPSFSGVSWIGGQVPTHPAGALTVTDYIFWSTDGGTTIYGGQLGAAGSGLSVTLSGQPDIGKIIIATGATTAEWAASARHAHIINELMLGNGTQTVFYLAQECAEPLQGVAAYVSGLRTSVTLGGMSDQITFPMAPGNLAEIRLDYIAFMTP